MVEGAFELGSSLKTYIFVSIVMVFFTFAYSYGVSQYQEAEIDLDDLNADLIMRRIFYSNECFAYEDGERIFFGELDLGKIDEERIKDCMAKDYLVKVSFDNLNKTIYNDKIGFENSKDFCKFKEKYSCYNNNQYVLIKHDNELNGDLMRIEVVKANG